jgi:hypothetical protein
LVKFPRLELTLFSAAAAWIYIGQTGSIVIWGKHALFCVVWLYVAMFKNLKSSVKRGISVTADSFVRIFVSVGART